MAQRYHAILSYFSKEGGRTVDQETLDKVQAIATRLKENEINTFDVANARGNIDDAIVAATDNSCAFVVFLTKAYIERANVPESQIRREFGYGLETRGHDNLILVVFEDELKDSKKWNGFFRFRVGNFAYIDMTTQELIDENIDALSEQILSKWT